MWILKKDLSACDVIENHDSSMFMWEFTDSELSGDMNYFYLNLGRYSKVHM